VDDRNSEKSKREIWKEKKARRQRRHAAWFTVVFTISFAIAFGLGLAAQTLFGGDSIPICVAIIFGLILIAFVGDMISYAGAYADLAVFNSMASRGIRGARFAVKIVKNNEKVSTMLCDILGDVCAVVSGAVGVTLAFCIMSMGDFSLWAEACILAAISAAISGATIAIKTISKAIARRHYSKILLFIGRVLHPFGR
jgi:CBS domain containing-hemolysin-like protein